MTKHTYLLDSTALQIDPNMIDLYVSPARTLPHMSPTQGRAIRDFLISRCGVAVLMGAVIAAPSRPPVIATEPFVAALVGDAAFTDDMKKYTGRVVRQIIERLGGKWVRRGVKVTVDSRYGSGSIYTFGGNLSLEVAA